MRMSALTSAGRSQSLTDTEAIAIQPRADERSEEAPPTSSQQGVPVYVMLPLDTVNSEGVFRYASSKWLCRALDTMRVSGVRGVAVDVWWGAVERQPKRYDWAGYRQLFDLVKSLGLKIQVVMSFHACGGNVGDSAQVPLPKWVLQAGDHDPDLFFMDRPRERWEPSQRNREYLSFFADEAPRALKGRQPIQCYTDFMRSFRDNFLADLGSNIEEVVVGTGPCGELRYPSYPEANGWRFPGVGEFQCYDRRALASLAQAARDAGQPEWGYGGPHDAGTYNSTPEETGFFATWGGSWDTPYGRFFLDWYHKSLLSHGERLLQAITSVFHTQHPRRCTLSNHFDSTQSIVATGYATPGGQSDAAASSLAGPQGSPSSQPASPASTRDDLPGRFTPADDPSSPRKTASGSMQPIPEQALGQADAADEDSPAASGAAPEAATPQASARRSGSGNAPDGLQASGWPPASPSRLLTSTVPTSSGPTTPSPDPAGSPQPGPSSHPSQEPPRPQKSVSLMSLSSYDGALPGSTRSEDGEASRLQSNPEQGLEVPAGKPIEVTLKVAGVHWWYRSRSHASELTAGYYNSDTRDGYNGIIEMCARHGVAMTLTCVEMCDAQHPPEALCGPEGLLRQVREGCAEAGVLLGGENALPCFAPGGVNAQGLDRIVYNTKALDPPLQEEAKLRGLGSSTQKGSSVSLVSNHTASSDSLSGLPSRSSEPLRHSALPMMRSLTFLRLAPEMLSPAYQGAWMRFMSRMQNNGIRDYQAEDAQNGW
ncbi:hypothetical protein WJX84_010292 [Apatococcus fuscideae]|uniref:Beta-amylase n=1 Tax=Apatococcus fuscideae TaxID=2026836 RepID=A0AAW1TI88_9CHLO